MNIPFLTLTLISGLLLTIALLSGCAETPPVKTTQAKSIQEIAAEAMRSKGKLSKEEINALIAANAKCTPKNTH